MEIKNFNHQGFKIKITAHDYSPNNRVYSYHVYDSTGELCCSVCNFSESFSYTQKIAIEYVESLHLENTTIKI
jgi:hypothetical protein